MAAKGCPVFGTPLVDAGRPSVARYTGIVVGEAPGRYEHAEQCPFVGAAGSFLRLRLQKLLDDKQQKRVFLTNATKRCPDCRPFKNPTVAQWQQMVCDHRKDLAREIRRHIAPDDSKAILALGRVALFAVTNDWNSNLKTTVGECLYTPNNIGLPPDIPVIPAYHPTYISTAPRQYHDWVEHICKWRAKI